MRTHPHPQHLCPHSSRTSTRSGSTLVIVVALLGLLAFLGFTFYTFAKQERTNAITFSTGAQVRKAPSLEPDTLFDYALEQFILGPPGTNFQSILWGGRHSLLANMLGRDGIPWNGEGVNLISDPSALGMPRVDLNYDGVADASDALLNFVDSPAGNNGLWAGKTFANIPAPDVNYSYPNIDNLFLSYDGLAYDPSNPTTPKRVIIPSFLRPQYLRTNSGGTVAFQLDTPSPLTSTYVPTNNWYYLQSNSSKSFRPHPSHVCIDSAGNTVMIPDAVGGATAGIPLPRFADPNTSDLAANQYQKIGLSRPFGSAILSFAPLKASGEPSFGNLGVWSNNIITGPQTPDQLDLSLDVDSDGDGVMDAILMDLGHPPIRRGDGKLVVPLFAIHVRDLNGLINLNAAGNLSGLPTELADYNSANSELNLASHQLGFKKDTNGDWLPARLSRSNLGLSTYEINPTRALTTKPIDIFNANSEISAQLNLHLQYMGYPTTGSAAGLAGRSSAELANLEWLLLNTGRPKYHQGLAYTAAPLINAISTVLPGRYGETSNAYGRNSSGISEVIVAYNSSSIAQFSPYTYNFSTDTRSSTLMKFLGTRNPFDLPKPGNSTAWYFGSSPPPNRALNFETSLVGAFEQLRNSDDNFNYDEGEYDSTNRWVHPLDFIGSGTHINHVDFGPDLKPGAANIDDDGNGLVDDIGEQGWIGSDDCGPDGRPGVAGVDDDGNLIVDDRAELGWAGSDDPYLRRGKVVAYVEFGGAKWPAYSGYQSFSNTVKWGEFASTGTFGQSLMANTRNASLIDEPTEAIIDPFLLSPNYSGAAKFRNSIQNDSVFGPHELAFLQGSSADVRSSQTASRLAELMPGNLVASPNAREIRKRFTTVSTDRREFGFAIPATGAAIPVSTGTQVLRNWETPFPPTLSTGPTGNPYRNELFLLLEQIAMQSSNQPLAQLKMNVNRLITAAAGQLQFRPLTPQTTIDDQLDSTHQATRDRQAMARDIYTLLYTLCHVHNDGTNSDTNYRPNTTVPVSAAQAKEMAQFAVNLVDALDTDDFITTFRYDPDLSEAGNGWVEADTRGPDGALGTPDDYVVYGVERQQLVISEAIALRVMPATSDSRMTIFDDSLTVTGGRHYLYFDLQNVTPFNVRLAPSTATAANAQTACDWRIRFFDVTTPLAPIELNTLYLLPGLNNADNRVLDTTGGPSVAGGGVFSVSSQDGTDKFTTGEFRTSDFRADQGTSGDFDTLYERNIPYGGPTESVVPAVSTAIGAETDPNRFPRPACNLDLVWGYPTSATPRFTLANNPTTIGTLANSLAGVTELQIVLERRVSDPDAFPAASWVAVDNTANGGATSANRLTVNPITPPNSYTDVLTTLQGISTFLRTIPLDRTSAAPTVSSTSAANVVTTNGICNPSPPSTSTAFQYHNDRDFASLSELLMIPLGGPDTLTNGRISNSEFSLTSGALTPAIAAARFLHPENPDDTSLTNFGNRWYRLLSLLEVADPSHRHPAIAGDPTYGMRTPALPLGSTSTTSAPTSLAEPFYLPQYFGWPKTFGRINLNMIRHPEVLNALLDDNLHIADPSLIPSATEFLDDTTTESTTRQWWWQFLRARESRYSATSAYSPDPVTNLYVPGTSSSRPFRGLDAQGRSATNLDSPLEDTILRSLPLDNSNSRTPNNARRLFEVGTLTDTFNTPGEEAAGAVGALNPMIRYQLLSKIMNNSTTRSNSFAVYVTVQYHEAVEYSGPYSGAAPTSAPVVIGGKLEDTPVHRGLFVIDRTGAIEQMKRLSSTPVELNTFSFRANTSAAANTLNGIRWKDLVLYRQTLN